MVEMICDETRTSRAAATVTTRLAMSDRAHVNAPVRGLAGSDLVSRFRHWSGVSGRRYLFSVFALPCPEAAIDCPRYEDAVVMAVARAPDGNRRILWAGQTGSLPDLVFEAEGLRNAMTRGANEVHMHLLAHDPAARDAMVRDIAG